MQHVVTVISPALLFATKSCSAIQHWIKAQPTEGANMMPGDMKRLSAAQSLNSPAIFRRGTSQKRLKSKKLSSPCFAVKRNFDPILHTFPCVTQDKVQFVIFRTWRAQNKTLSSLFKKNFSRCLRINSIKSYVYQYSRYDVTTHPAGLHCNK